MGEDLLRMGLAAGALWLDRLIGDPVWLPHPVVWIGRFIAFWDKCCNRPTYAERVRRAFGVALVVLTVGLTWGVVWGGLRAVTMYSSLLASLLAIWLTAITIAWKGLNQAGLAVYRCLMQGDLPAARAAVARIVGRDTDQLSEQEVVRAAVETLAENIVDAIVAPVCFALIGGAPLAFAYRAVNTLDSMVGYKSDRYLAFGWASARLDDVLNYVPARLTALMLWVALLGARGAAAANKGWAIYRRDARLHPSPNSGIPEAMVAGGLGVRLGGYNTYHGVMSLRAYMGDDTRPLVPSDIALVTRLVSGVAWLLSILTLFCAGAT